MKILFIGGTGNISTAVSNRAVAQGHELFLLNRGKTPLEVEGAHSVVADIKDEAAVEKALGGQTFDVVANFIAFTRQDIERDLRLFAGKCGQYIFISSASAYAKPAGSPFITESTPLKNPHWDYSRNKIACEECLLRAYREDDFPMTIIRPSLTYDKVIPAAIGSWDDFTIIERIRAGKPIIVHGDGTSLWTITHSEDFATGMVGLLGHQLAVGEAFHITSDEVLNWNQIYQCICHAAGAETEFVHIPSDFIARMIPWQEGNLHGDKAQSVIFDNSKLKRFVPGFNAPITFKEGIARTVAWFEAKPERIRIDAGTNQAMDKIIAAYKSAFDQAKPL